MVVIDIDRLIPDAASEIESEGESEIDFEMGDDIPVAIQVGPFLSPPKC